MHGKHTVAWYRKASHAKADIARRIIQAAKAQPCADCGIQYPPCAMDFDHVRGEKKRNVAQCLSRSARIVLEEIAKCEVVCANCHRIRTHIQRPEQQ